MKLITKLAMGAVIAAGLATPVAAPAQAGVSVGVGIGVPGPGYGYRAHYCRFHPCGRPGVGVGVGVGPVGVSVGTFVAGRGYWDGHGWYAHRLWRHGRWYYR